MVRSEQHYHKDEFRRLALRKHLFEAAAKVPPETPLEDEFFEYSRLLIVELQSEGIIDEFTGIMPRVLDGLQTLQEAKATHGDAEDWLHFMLDNNGNDIGDIYLAIKGVLYGSTFCIHGPREPSFGKYLGFVDIRLNSPTSPVAFGLLVAPRRFRHDTSIRLIEGNYGPLFGGEGFLATPFSMHDPIAGGALCAQACIIMALASLSDRGAKVVGSYDLTYLAKRRDHQAPSEQAAVDCLSLSTETEEVFKIGGLTISEIDHVLNLELCNTRCLSLRLPGTEQNERVFAKLVEAYVEARYPIILLVNANKWWRQGNSIGHGVVVVGFKKFEAPSEFLSHLIVNDPGYLPFNQVPLNHCLLAAYEFDAQHRNMIHVAFPVERWIQRHAYHCILYLQASPDDEGDRIPWEEFSTYRGKSIGADFRISLVQKSEIVHTCLRRRNRDTLFSEDASPVDAYEDATSKLNDEWYWALIGTKSGRVERAWLFSAQQNNGGGWSLRFSMRDSNYVVDLPDE